LVCGVGGAVFYPLLNRKGCRLITHVDGREELRGKYSFLKKMYVRAAQLFVAKYSDHIIADSFAVRKYWMEKYDLPSGKVSVIEFGASFIEQPDEHILGELNLRSGSYFLVVCRMVPENNLEIILKGFIKSGSKLKLVLIGDLSDNFGSSLKHYASENIIFLNAIYRKAALFTLRKNCFAYIHGHSVGGTNPSLLEAMAAGNICICHDNEFNRETTENKLIYFRDEVELANRINQTTMFSESERNLYIEVASQRILNYYNWNRITGEYLQLFKRF
jgi:glycosyltransferase involved in cell wall biosynthesis